MKNDHLDRYIKDSLEQFDAGSPGNSWSALDQKLNDWDSVDSSFDDSIKNKLENIDADLEPSWLTMVAALDFVPDLDHINEDIILDDKALGLSDLEVEYNPASWDMLQDKITLDEDLSEIEMPEEVDLAAYDKLSGLNIPYNENHWDIFQPELDKEFILPYKLLFKYKLVEVSMILLLLVGIYQHVPLPLNKNQSNYALVEDVASKDKDLTSFGEAEKMKSQKITTTLNNVQKEQSTEDSAVESIASSSVKAKEIKLVQATGFTAEKKSADHVGKFKASVDLFNSPLNKFSVDQGVEANSQEQILAKVDGPETSLDEEKNKFSPKIKSAILGILNFNPNKIVPNCLVCDNPAPLFNWRLTAQVNTDYNYIMTPYDKVLSVNSYAHGAFGYGAGIASSVGIGNWDLEFGANYVGRTYTPNPIQEKVGNLSDGYLRIELEKIELNLLSIPLNVRYYFNNNGKTKYFVSGGASMNVAMQANYYRTAEFASREKTLDLKSTDDLLDKTLINSQKIYSLGWIDGGTFNENKFLTADLGLGLERKITNRYSIFGQATYQHYLDKGIGPNNDRFNTLRFSAGARAKFR